MPSILEFLTPIVSLFVSTVVLTKFPSEVRQEFSETFVKLVGLFNATVTVTFPEFSGGDAPQRNAAFAGIQRYLNHISREQAMNLETHLPRDSERMVLSITGDEEVSDEFEGVKLCWKSCPTDDDEKKILKLQFENKNRTLVLDQYLEYVMEEGKSLLAQERKRKLYSNKPGGSGGQGRRTLWNHVGFQHRANFETLAMDPERKADLIQDRETFSRSKEYYAKLAKPWKRGYLIHGPPGTGKSTLIAAIANYLNYDVYDLELTAVKNNSELKELVISTSSKSLIVIEDIDCSLDLTGRREESDSDSPSGDVTLSGLLNTIDGLWSSCGDEKVFIFTTNFVDKLDPALLRTGRMDKFVEMSNCNFASFKILAKNYLGIQDHLLFDEIQPLLEQCKISPADVAEHLMPNYPGEDEESRLRKLIGELEKRA